MEVYSKKIIRFINDVKTTLKWILEKEIGLKVSGDRFYSKCLHYSYPIKVVIYNHKPQLGYFDPEFFALGFHEQLMHSNRAQTVNIIRHELAHYMTFILYGNTIQPHSNEFRAFCQSLGWSEEVYRAADSLDTSGTPFSVEGSAILRKVQKLMALTSSSNKNEAEQAMIKSQQLLLKHNIDVDRASYEDNDEKIYLKRILKQKKENAKMRSIALILGTFLVNTVYTRGIEGIYLEITGSLVNIEIADYVASFLDRELDKLWDNAKQHAGLKGMKAKNSFFLGIAKGYCNKVNSLKKEYDSEMNKALMVLEKKLVDVQSMIYSRLSYGKSSGGYCHHSSMLGQQAGRELSIHAGLNSSPIESGTYLS